MAYISFNKQQLINLEFSLNKELIRSNRAGAYASTTLCGCNTRKYHGLLVCPQPAIDNDLHVLLSSIDETVIQHNTEFNLSIRRYPGIYEPKGHKYLELFETDPIPITQYRVGGVLLQKEMLLASDDRILIKYTLLDAHSETKIRIRPFLAFRNYHQLSKSNVFVNTKFNAEENGVSIKMYQGYTPIYMQFSKENEYIHVPDWYYNIEYSKELARGYDGHEDLFVPGFFELMIEKGESVVFSAGTTPVSTAQLKRTFSNEIRKRVPRNNFENCLINSAQQFVIQRGKDVDVKAGYHWFGRWGRDSFIALPGLTLITSESSLCKAAIDTLLKDMKGPLLPNVGIGSNSAFNSVDAPLWFFWTLQQYQRFTGTAGLKIWDLYGKAMKEILYGYREAKAPGIRMTPEGLIHAELPGHALTWMDAIVAGKPVTPRYGMPVEINALWYNAVMYTMELAVLAEDEVFVSDWLRIAENFPNHFKNTFWDKNKGYLADVVNGDYKDWCVRPNMVFATSLPYVALSEKIRELILKKVETDLLTTCGLRTLSPNCPDYQGRYEGPISQRDSAYHQGTVWPWLLGHFAEGYLRIHGKSGVAFVERIYRNMEETMFEHGLTTIGEVYDGDPPHKAGGAVSQAWSVAEVLRIKWLLNLYK